MREFMQMMDEFNLPKQYPEVVIAVSVLLFLGGFVALRNGHNSDVQGAGKLFMFVGAVGTVVSGLYLMGILS